MFSRQLEQLAQQRSNELKATTRSLQAGATGRRTRQPIRSQTGWALVAIGLRLAESGSR